MAHHNTYDFLSSIHKRLPWFFHHNRILNLGLPPRHKPTPENTVQNLFDQCDQITVNPANTPLVDVTIPPHEFSAPNHFFDVVLLHHNDQHDQHLTEKLNLANKLLKPQGLLILTHTSPNTPNRQSNIHQLLDADNQFHDITWSHNPDQSDLYFAGIKNPTSTSSPQPFTPPTRYHIAVTTLNRITDVPNDSRTDAHEQSNYLHESIHSLMEIAAAKAFPPDFLQISIFDSGSTDTSFLDPITKQYPQIQIHHAPRRLTLNENANRALQHAASTAQHPILMQDDIIFAKNALLALDQWIQNIPETSRDYACLTLWNCASIGSGDYPEIPHDAFWGSCFLIFQPALALAFTNSFSHPPDEWQREVQSGRCHDMILKLWAKRTNRRIIMNPNGLIQHIGKYSSLCRRPDRTTFFAGDKHSSVHNPSAMLSQTTSGEFHKAHRPLNVSIAITCQNQSRYTDQALESLLQHTQDDDQYRFSYLLLDDASTDDTPHIAKKYSHRGVSYWQNRKPLGLTSLWNRAYQLSENADYLLIVNNDVLFSNNWCHTMINAMIPRNRAMGGPITNGPGHVDTQNVRNFIPNYQPSDNPADIADTVQSLVNQKPFKVSRINGFCMAFKLDFLKMAAHNRSNQPFNPRNEQFGGEDEIQERFNPGPIVVPASFVFHYKQVSVGTDRATYDTYRLRGDESQSQTKTPAAQSHNFYIMSTLETIELISSRLQSDQPFSYTRFGDGDFLLIDGEPEEMLHQNSSALQNELIQALTIEHENYLRGVGCAYKEEPGMEDGIFARFKNDRKIQSILARHTDTRTFPNFNPFSYLAVFNPVPLLNFLQKHIQPRKKIFVGSVDPAPIQKVFGPIDHHIQIPPTNAYYAMNDWYPKLQSAADDDSPLILIAAGMASRVTAKRLWLENKPVQLIDASSLVDAIAGNQTRTWIRKKGQLAQKNLGLT